MKPKTVKAFLKTCIDLSSVDRPSLKGCSKLTDYDYEQLGAIRAAIQNELGEMSDLLEKNGLKY
jgi:hypothetical protein